MSSPPKYNEVPTFEQTKTRSLELFYSVFNLNMVDSPCHMIFQFKKSIQYTELRKRVFESQMLMKKTFKSFNNGMGEGETPIKNRKDLYLLLKEFCIGWNSKPLFMPPPDYQMLTRMMSFLTNRPNFTFEVPLLIEVFLSYKSFNKKCQGSLVYLDRQTQTQRLTEYLKQPDLSIGETRLANSGLLRLLN
ncbi:MAG: hypothetical protein ACJATM_001304 [Alphaproteobacteria bacterium]|jgi:hypothetical protein